MGCLRTIGCLTVLAMVAVVGFLTRDLWWDSMRADVRAEVRAHHWTPWRSPGRSRPGRTAGSEPPASDSSAWEPLTAAGAARTKARIAALGARGGPAFVAVPGGDFASYMVLDQGAGIPHPTDSTRAAVIADALHLRTVVDLRSLDRNGLGPVANLLGDVQPVELVGTLDMVRPGVAEFRVTELVVGGIGVPDALIPRLMLGLEGEHHQAGAADNGVLIPLPSAVGDVRASLGRVTMYRSTP
jgi:hypothetical protein